jgi:hypothetical protein
VHAQAADVHAQDRARVLARLLAALRDLDPPELAAPADLNLRLDDSWIADRLGGLDRLVDGRGGAPAGHRYAVAREQLLSLVFE